jgi:Cu(I)/Ag(I) efflux system membrane fusion protein
MKHAYIATFVLGGALLGAGGYLLGRQSAAHGDPALPAEAATTASERKALYWHDPMVPGPRFDTPGKSPFMDMQLVPVYADNQGGSGVKVSPDVQQNLGIRTAAVMRTEVASSLDAVGTVQFDERLTEAVQTRVNGYVERLLVRAPMEAVRQGQALATIFAPDWLGPQNEYLALKRAGASEELVAASRERIRALSIPDALLRQSEAIGVAQARFTVVAPVGGVIVELGVRDGVAVSPSMTLFRIAGLEKVWVVADVPEAQAMSLRRGQKAKATSQVDSSHSVEGQLKEILPQVNASTRTVQARFDVPNPGGRLMPGMLLRLQVAGPTTKRLIVPAEAVIRTGARAVVIAQNENGAFEPREVVLGTDLGDQLEVLRGLDEGEKVVVAHSTDGGQ